MTFYDECREVHAENVSRGWWSNPKTGESILETRDRGNLLCLMHSEITEAVLGGVKPDDKLPQYPGWAVELCDADIRSRDAIGAELALGNEPTSEMLEAAIDQSIEARMNCNTVPSGGSSILGAFLTLHALLDIAMEHVRKGRRQEYCAMLTAFSFEIVQTFNTLRHFFGSPVEHLNVPLVSHVKREFNGKRADHKPENRVKAGGKEF